MVVANIDIANIANTNILQLMVDAVARENLLNYSLVSFYASEQDQSLMLFSKTSISQAFGKISAPILSHRTAWHVGVTRAESVM